ncbi:MAG TPA: hypothetical protein VFD59_07435 [Nocardioidaceae bacterium]|nr:hypothetical protein [Nocardioidaceae bacterium]
MNTPFAGGAAKVVGFLIALLAAFGIAVGVGNAVRPVAQTIPSAHEKAAHDQAGQAATDQVDPTSPQEVAAADIPGGLMLSQNGYTFSLTRPTTSPGKTVPVSFTIGGPDGEPVTDYDVAHGKRLHLIAVRRDFTGFQHVHPELDQAGVWATELDLTSGQWRLFADFMAAGTEPVTLGADLAVPGSYRPAAPGPESRTVHVDGYTVTIDGDLRPGAHARLRLTVTRDGRPVMDLQPYLGSYGHLAALRAGDLAYLHVHPDGEPGDGTTEPGPDIVFYASVPSVGTYHLYLDFQHDGVVRTAAFTVHAADVAPGGQDGPTGDHTETRTAPTEPSPTNYRSPRRHS